MKCVICQLGEMRPGNTTLTLERGSLTLVIKDIPAAVCDNCGEATIDEEISAQLLQSAEEAAQAGVEVDVRHYQAV